ncbi:GspH/FimT family pseudopilin [Desulfohalobium retbaense]|nr:GspH/FimT family pseudopilin [Desulfohalobium retbaense]
MTQLPSKFRRPKLGFTLLEVIAVLVLLGVLATLALPRLSGLYSSLDVQEIRDQFIGDLRQARSMAQGCAKTVVNVTTSGNDWSVAPDPDDCGYSISRTNLPDEIAIAIDGPILFQYPEGNLSGSSVTITLSANGDSQHVCVDGSTGAIQRRACN